LGGSSIPAIDHLEKPPENVRERHLGQSWKADAVCGVQEYAECAAPPPFGEAAHEFLAPHILWRPEGGQEFIDRAEVAAAKMRVRHRFDGFQLLGWVCFQVHFRGLHLCVPEP